MEIRTLRLALLDEMKLPDFKGRHLFVAKLRLIIFFLCWILFIIFYPSVWSVAPYVPLVFNVGFLVTAICYWNIVNEKYILTMAVWEVLADVVSQTSLIYILGSDTTVVFLFYGLYVVTAGSFFGYITALIAATGALLSYCTLLFLLQSGFLPAVASPSAGSPFFRTEGFGYIFNLVCLPGALGVAVYAAKIGHYFSKVKERALEMRNVQLLALNRIGSTIRRALNIKDVVDQVLKGVIEGLGFDVCFLALLSKKGDRVQFFVPKGNRFTVKMEEMLSHPLTDHYLPVEATENSAYQSILKNRVIFRNDMMELTRGLVPEITLEHTKRIQEELQFKKFVITPLVAERKVVGALIGASRKSYVEESVVDALDNFSNQGALAIESAQLFEELKMKNIQLEKANKIKSDFLAIMSHELRTPLTAIIGFTEIMLENVLGALNKEQKDSLSEVLKNAENLLELINSILDLAKVEAGKMELSLEKFPVMDIVSEVQQTVAPLVSRKGQRLVVDVPKDIPSLQADPRKLRQILLNLVGNAIKFTPDRGEIFISVRYFRKADVLTQEFHLDPRRYVNGGVFRLAVRDTGIGIKADQLSHLFDIFQQVDSTFTRRYQGTGLGLALSKQLVELHKGVIAVTSEFGKGSEFKFILPEEAPVQKNKI